MYRWCDNGWECEGREKKWEENLKSRIFWKENLNNKTPGCKFPLPACLDRQPCHPFLSHLESDSHLLDGSGHQRDLIMNDAMDACLMFALAWFGWPKAAANWIFHFFLASMLNSQTIKIISSQQPAASSQRTAYLAKIIIIKNICISHFSRK